MNETLLDSETLSIAMLKSVLESAHFDCEIDERGDLRVEDDLIVFLLAKGESILKFVTLFGFTEDADPYGALELEHRVNESSNCVKALASIDHRVFSVSWFVNVEGGITGRNLVSTFHKFQNFARMIDVYDEDDLLE